MEYLVLKNSCESHLCLLSTSVSSCTPFEMKNLRGPVSDRGTMAHTNREEEEEEEEEEESHAWDAFPGRFFFLTHHHLNVI